MKLKIAREIGNGCGLETDAECIANIDIHCMNLFAYGDIDKELKELALDCIANGLDYDKIMNDYHNRMNLMISKARGY